MIVLYDIMIIPIYVIRCVHDNYMTCVTFYDDVPTHMIGDVLRYDLIMNNDQ